MSHSFSFKNRGFTLIEMLVVVFIIVVLTAILLTNYKKGQQQLALERTANKLSQDIRRAQGMAMAAEEFGGGIPKGGYGVYLNISDPTNYILFADISDPPNYQYDGILERVGYLLEFEKEVEIDSLSPSPLTITFTPPDPTVRINQLTTTLESAITIRLKAQPSTTKTIIVNKAGLIYVE